MGVYLEGKKCEAEMTTIGWCAMLELAQRWGWEPAGMVPRKRRRKGAGAKKCGEEVIDRHFAYTLNTGDTVTEDDAARLADALEAAYAVLKIRSPSTEQAISAYQRAQNLDWESNDPFSKVSTDDLLDRWGHQIEGLEDVICVAKEGAFNIH